MATRGVTHETLAPEGYIKIQGELRKAQTSGRPIAQDRAVKVTGAQGMTLIVEAEDGRR
ncbi:MAG: NfeD family protein [Candidatus Binatia bacterium]